MAFRMVRHKQQTERFLQTTQQNKLASRKMQLASTLAEHARARTRLTTEMIYQQDPLDTKDTGIGIPEEARDRLFDSFTQVDSSNPCRSSGIASGHPFSVPS
jgi:signal transduction histidine kinase